MCVGDGSDRAPCSTVLQTAHKHFLVIEGECCNLLRRLHMAQGEFGTILLALWSTEWSYSVRGAKTLVHFHQPSWHKFSLTCWNDYQSSLLAQWKDRTRDRKYCGLSLKPDCSFFFFLRIPCPEYVTHMNMNTGTYSHSVAKPLNCSQIFWLFPPSTHQWNLLNHCCLRHLAPLRILNVGNCMIGNISGFSQLWTQPTDYRLGLTYLLFTQCLPFSSKE